MADVPDSKPGPRKRVWVQVPPSVLPSQGKSQTSRSSERQERYHTELMLTTPALRSVSGLAFKHEETQILAHWHDPSSPRTKSSSQEPPSRGLRGKPCQRPTILGRFDDGIEAALYRSPRKALVTRGDGRNISLSLKHLETIAAGRIPESFRST
jgi:hypothetical protein